MNPRNWLNLILLLAVGGLIALTIHQPGIDAPTPAPMLTNIDPATITRMALQRPSHPELLLTRAEPGGWRMEKPFQAPANPFIDTSLSGLLTALSSAHYPVSELDPANIGLAPPVATLELDNIELLFGDIDPVHGNRYVQIGDIVHLIPDHIAFYPTTSADQWVSPALLPVGAIIETLRLPTLPSTNSATIHAGDGDPAHLGTAPPRSLTREAGSWRLDPPLPLSGDALTGLITEWTHAQALSISPIQGEPRDSPPLGSIELTLQQSESIKFNVVSFTPELILARHASGLRYHLSVEQGQRLLRPSLHNPTEE